MRLHRIVALGLVLAWLGALLLPLWHAAQAQSVQPFVPGELLIKMKPNVPPAAVRDMMTRIQAKPLENLGPGWVRVRMSNPAVEQLVPWVRQLPQVAMAEPNYLVQAIGIPNDPYFSKLWGLNNTGQTGGASGADIDAPEAWDNFAPAGNAVVVAVIDTGIDTTHPDLAGRMWANPNEIAGNGVDDDKNGYIDDTRGWDYVSNDNDPTDDNNHGTHVAGTIAASFNNSQGIAGVAGPANVRLMPLKFLNSSGSGAISNAIKALDYATTKGAVISNNSWGGTSYSQALADAIARNYQAGRLFVAAAGNNATNTDATPYYPQGYNVPSVISVAAMTASDTLASFSNYGGQSVDLAAPGSSIYSTVRGGYALYSGTSMATPHVAGAAALIWAKNSALTNVQVKRILMDSSRKAAYLTGKTVTGGVLNLKNAMLATSSPGTSPAPAPSPSPSIPAAPSSLAAQPILVKKTYYSIRTAKLTWKDNAANETGYEVWYSKSATSGFSRIKVLASNITTWTHQISYSPMTTNAYYKVRAYNANGASAFSNVVKVSRF